MKNTKNDEQADDRIIRFVATPVSHFQVRRMPLLGHLYRIANTSRYRLSGQFVQRQTLGLYHVARAAGLGGTGIVRLRRPAGDRAIRFDVRNTQFHALYMPEHLPCYEPATTAFIDRVVNATDTFFDIGANWGWYVVAVANRPGFSGKVHAFEPHPASFPDLIEVISQAGLGAHVECHNIAIGDHDGDTKMSIPDRIHSGLAKLDGNGDISVMLAQLDSLDFPSPDVMKLDVEDHEYDVLLGAQQVIAAGRPIVVFEN